MAVIYTRHIVSRRYAYDAPHIIIIFYCTYTWDLFFFTPPPRWKITRFNTHTHPLRVFTLCACRFNLNAIEYNIVDPPAGGTTAATMAAAMMCRIDNAVNSLLLYGDYITREKTHRAQILQYCLDRGRLQLGGRTFRYNQKPARKCANFPSGIQTFTLDRLW